MLIKNANIINEAGETEIKDIYIADGVIGKIDDKINTAMVDTIDASGFYALPGLIDMCCNTRDPGLEYKEDIRSVSKSAAKGGFTTITCSPDTNPAIDSKTVVSYIYTKSKRRSIVNIIPYGSMTKGNAGTEMADIGEMVDAGIFAVSDGGNSIVDSNVLRNILIYAKMFNIPVITHCDDMAISNYGVVNKGLISTATGLTGIPREAEEIFVARDIILAKHNNAKLHISQITTRGSVELVRNAKKEGVNVTCGVSAHHFSLTENEVESYNTFAKVRPPLRTSDDVEGLIEGLVDGTIDVICSGHSPVGIEDKTAEFDKALYGISSLETTFSISYTELVQKKILSLNELITKMVTEPAKILNLKSRGRIAEGFDADIVITDLNKLRTINASQFASKAKFSPFSGKNVCSEIKYTIVGGKIVYIEEQLEV